MMQERVFPMTDGERQALASRAYWQKVADTETDEAIRKNALHYVSMYENDILILEGIHKRFADREARRNAYVAPPPLTLFEMACAPLYWAQLFFQGLFLTGMWTAIAFVVLGSLIGLGGYWAIITFGVIGLVAWGKWPIIITAFIAILISGELL